ncbi:hypothetical protein [Kineococcus arenarius]|uniref:hypothetical protein n=1 Tax=Kineococcus sp. SYSU DK007 TaxID=3383128 RepID=UPI003D7C8F72
MHRPVSVLPVLAVLLIAGCSDEPETVNEQNVAVCISPEGDLPATGRMDVEFRQDGKVLATGSANIGGAVGARVPNGEIDVYVNGELYGHAAGYTPGTLDEDGELQGVTYLSGPGCPEEAPIG